VILLADTSILIDLEHVGSIGMLPLLGQCEVLDVVLAECEHQSQPELVRNIVSAGIAVIETTRELATRASSLRRGGVSVNDMMTICYAKEHGQVVLAGDRPMRERCAELAVECRGSIWIVEEAHRLGVREAAELLRWLSVWQTVGRRLPMEELNRLKTLLSE